MKFLFAAAVGLLAASVAFGAQRGPVFPTHHYPTDKSFELGYDFSWFNSDSNFVGPLTTDPLLQNSKLRVLQHTLSAEFQPNRQASIGFNLNIDSLSLTSPSATAAQSKTGLGDQSLFAEYRFFDEPGRSLGFAIVSKFPFYSNPSLQQVKDADGSAVLFGDAQTDFTLMLTSEYWPSSVLRMQFDAGFMFRTSGYSSELPFQYTVGIVTPKMDLSLKVNGNLSLDKGSIDPNSDEAQIQKSFAGSMYALSQSPWTINLEPSLELWIKPTWGAVFSFAYSMAGNDAPHYVQFMLGLHYRFAERVVNRKRTFKQVDIHTDQEAGKFQGEEQEGNSEPKAPNPRPIPEDTTKDEVFR